MLGQSFFPGGDDQQRMQEGGAGPVNPVQEAIKVLSLKLPRFLGNAPAPPQLLSGMGGAALNNPLAQLILQQFMPQMMGGQQAGPMAQMGGGATGGGMPPAPQTTPKPKIDFMPNPGGTAGPDPYGQRSPFSDLPEPLQAGPGKRVSSA